MLSVVYTQRKKIKILYGTVHSHTVQNIKASSSSSATDTEKHVFFSYHTSRAPTYWFLCLCLLCCVRLMYHWWITRAWSQHIFRANLPTINFMAAGIARKNSVKYVFFDAAKMAPRTHSHRHHCLLHHIFTYSRARHIGKLNDVWNVVVYILTRTNNAILYTKISWTQIA